MERKTFEEFESMDAKPATLWKGWYFDGVLIYDDCGNHYNMNDIRMSWQVDHFLMKRKGTIHEIQSLKEILERKIKSLNSEITLSWGEKSIVINLDNY